MIWVGRPRKIGLSAPAGSNRAGGEQRAAAKADIRAAVLSASKEKNEDCLR